MRSPNQRLGWAPCDLRPTPRWKLLLLSDCRAMSGGEWTVAWLKSYDLDAALPFQGFLATVQPGAPAFIILQNSVSRQYYW